MDIVHRVSSSCFRVVSQHNDDVNMNIILLLPLEGTIDHPRGHHAGGHARGHHGVFVVLAAMLLLLLMVVVVACSRRTETSLAA